MVEEFLREENNDIDRAVNRVKAVEWDTKPFTRQPEKAYVINTDVRVKLILDHMKNSKRSEVQRFRGSKVPFSSPD